MSTVCIHCQGIHDSHDCPHWEPTSERYIYHNKADNTYWFADETENVDGNGPYPTIEDAVKGLHSYSKWLNGDSI